MPTIESTLYFANWCGHCHAFVPQWDAFAKKINKEGGVVNGTKIKVAKFEESQMGGKKALINGKEIRGFPTVKIVVTDDNGKKVEYEYSGKRNADFLYNHITVDAIKNLEENLEE